MNFIGIIELASIIYCFYSLISNHGKVYSQSYSLNKIGFYNYKIKKHSNVFCKHFNGGNIRIFIFCKHFNSDNVRFCIDDKNYTISDLSNSNYTNGIVIEVEKKAVIQFIAKNKEYDVNIWLLPSYLCSNLSIYAYNKYLIDLVFPFTVSPLCIFSPIIDSKNNQFKINYESISKNNSITSSLYTNSFYIPEKTKTSNKIINTKIQGPFFIQFKMNSNFSKDNPANNIIHYQRKTKQINRENEIVDTIATNQSGSYLTPLIEVYSENLNRFYSFLWTVLPFFTPILIQIIYEILTIKKTNYLIIGLKNAGKKTIATCIARHLKGTIEYDDKMEKIKEVTLSDNSDAPHIKIVDFGEESIPSYGFFDKITILIFVLDVSDITNLDDVEEAFKKILLNDRFKGVNILIYFNKADCLEDDSKERIMTILERLNFESITDRKWHVEACSGKEATGILQGLLAMFKFDK